MTKDIKEITIPKDINPFLFSADNQVLSKIHIVEQTHTFDLSDPLSIKKLDKVLPQGTAEKGEGILIVGGGDPNKEKTKPKFKYKGNLWVQSDLNLNSPNMVIMSNSIIKPEELKGFALHVLLPVSPTNPSHNKPLVPFVGVLARWEKKIDNINLNVNAGPLLDPNKEMDLKGFRFIGNISQGNVGFRVIEDLGKDGSFLSLSMHARYKFYNSDKLKIESTLGVEANKSLPIPAKMIKAGIELAF